MLILYHTSHCPNCQTQKKILTQLQAQNPEIHFQSINLEESPGMQIIPPIQSVPTLYINDYRFEGLMTTNEIKKWLNPDTRDKDYIQHLLKGGLLSFALQWLQQHPTAIPCIADLLADDTIEMSVRIGIDALIELLAETDDLSILVHPLGKLLATVSDSLCIDILHYLAMTTTTDATHYIQSCVNHVHPEVRRVASELLEELNA